MSTLIVAFPKIEEAKAVRNLLVRKGYDVAIPSCGIKKPLGRLSG